MNGNQNNDVLLHLSLIPGIGSVTVNALVQNLSALQLDQLYSMNHADLMNLGLNAKTAGLLFDGLADKKIIEEEKNLLDQHAINIMTLFDDDYPLLLKQIYMAPIVLYVQGKLLKKEERCLAIVGSRQASGYAKQVVEYIIPELVARTWTIVSGGALGADTFAHQSALVHKGRTIAVLGSGLLRHYPYQNKKLFQTIIEQGGTIVSPFPLRMDPLPGNFPARNRIIAGIAQGCLVVQAKKKSGARITAQFALEQGREVFAIPGLITDPLSQGCHDLIVQGARLINNASEILYELGDQKHTVSHEQVPIASALKVSRIQELILIHCVNPISIDELLPITELSLIELQSELFDLHIEGLIKQHFNGLWQVI